MSMRSAVDGTVMTQIKTGGREYDIRVTLADTEVSSYESIRNIPVSTSKGIYPLSYFAEIEIEDGISKLLRISKKSSVEISSNLLPGAPLSRVTSAIDEAAGEILPADITLKWGGDAEMMQDTMKNMAFAFLIAIALTYMLLAAILEKGGTAGADPLYRSPLPYWSCGDISYYRLQYEYDIHDGHSYAGRYGC